MKYLLHSEENWNVTSALWMYCLFIVGLDLCVLLGNWFAFSRLPFSLSSFGTVCFVCIFCFVLYVSSFYYKITSEYCRKLHCTEKTTTNIYIDRCLFFLMCLYM